MHYFVDSILRICIMEIVSDALAASDWGLGTQSTSELMKLQSGFAGISLNYLKEVSIMDIKLSHRVWRDVTDILFSDVKGDGLNAYRTTSIRLALTMARRLGWVQKGTIRHFEAVLWQQATDAIENGVWSGKKSSAMRYYFWRFISTEASRLALNLGTQDAKIAKDKAKETPWERELDQARTKRVA